MEVLKLTRAKHGKAVHAVLGYTGYKVNVYIRHNVPCRDRWDTGIYISCYTSCNNGNAVVDKMATFRSYAKFRKFKSMFKTNK